MVSESRAESLPHIGYDREPDIEAPRRTRRRPAPDVPERDRSGHGTTIRSGIDLSVSGIESTRRQHGITPERLKVLAFRSLDSGRRDVLEKRFSATVVD